MNCLVMFSLFASGEDGSAQIVLSCLFLN